MATAQVQEGPSEPLKYKTWILKVSVHCQGCKKKVHKILTNIPGVYSADIEIRQQKVIVTGNVEAETLINKLIKSGKNAELWPENPVQKEMIKPAKPNNKEKHNHQQPDKETGLGSVNGDKEIKPPAKAEKTQDSTKSGDAIGRGAGDGEIPAKPDEDTKVGEVAGKVSGGGQVGKESKSEGKLPQTGSAGYKPPPPVVLKKVDESEIGDEKSGAGDGGENGNGGKKKKKKGQNSNKTVRDGPPSVSPPASTTSVHFHYNGGPSPVSIPANHNPPHHQEDHYQPPLHYYTPPPPVYGVSYNMAHPSSSYTASYYAAQPPSSYAYPHPGSGTEHMYSYLHPGSGMEHQPQDFGSYPRQPLDSLEMFSDENPNGCSIS